MAKSQHHWETLKGDDLQEVLPCPFCGEFTDEKQNFLARVTDRNGFKAIRCDGCLCEPNFCCTTWEEATKRWNSRITFSEEQEFQAGIEYYKRYLIDLMS